jgi:hypothetical protein
MTATAQTDFWQEQADEPQICIEGQIDPQVHEAYWQTVYWGESYYRREYDYEDYAPAYCVGYIGYAQYGGDFADAEKSLCANWLRVKGTSRLGLDEAMQAIRAAWTHAEQAAAAHVRVEDEVESQRFTMAVARAGMSRQPALAAA